MANAPLISIVDDDESIRLSLDSLIRSLGFRAQGYSSAEAFLSAGQLQDTACVILDVRMPGMSGVDLQQNLAASHWHVPIIFITSHVDDVRTRAMDTGAVAFLYKPFHEEDLLNAIHTALKHS